jgi:hypothetical protein
MEESTGLLLHLPSTWGSSTAINKSVNTKAKQKEPRKRKRQQIQDDTIESHVDSSSAAMPPCNKCDTTEADDESSVTNIEVPKIVTKPGSDTAEYCTIKKTFHREQKKAVERNEKMAGVNANVAYSSVSEKVHDIYAAIVKAPQARYPDARHSVHPKDCIELESIVANVPFLETMQSMFSLEKTNMTRKYNIPIITKDYEEMYMRESFLTEDVDCIMGVNCECMFVDAQMPFIGTRFWSEQFVTNNAEAPISNKMCVLCCRKNTQQLFYDLIFSGVRFNGYIQLYGNICAVPNEYAKEAVLICPPNGPISCMPFPVVSHQRNRYSVVVKNGVKYIQQHNVYFEDFQKPSSFI